LLFVPGTRFRNRRQGEDYPVSKRLTGILIAVIAVAAFYFLLSRRPGVVPGQTSAQVQNHEYSDELVTGPYQVVEGWPKPLATLFPEEKGWTWGSTQAVYAQNPNRIFIGMRGELPIIRGCTGDVNSMDSCKPLNVEVPGIGEDGRSVWLTVPTPLLPPRNASVGPTASPGEPHVKFVAQEGRDYRYQHLIFAVDGRGNLVDDWSRWDKTFKRPHKILISPYDPEKRVWVDDDGRCAIFVFSNDGKQLLQTIGTPNQCGDDATHFNRQTDIAWLPDGTFFVTDGYENTRVVKFDKNGKYITSWGKPSWDWRTRKDVPGLPTPPPPNYFHTVHGIQVDPVTHRVYVSDRENHRIQVFDENGKFLDIWPLGPYAAIYHMLETADRSMWMSDGHGTWKILKYDLDGRLLYSWGTFGPMPGELWGVHEISTDQDGNLFTAEVFNGRAQKFRPRPGADPTHLMGQQMRVAWKD
jgi:peptidylamidoglycolate lyase